MISGWGRIEVNLFAKIHLTLETKLGDDLLEIILKPSLLIKRYIFTLLLALISSNRYCQQYGKNLDATPSKFELDKCYQFETWLNNLT